jgi:hypothetical protein
VSEDTLNGTLRIELGEYPFGQHTVSVLQVTTPTFKVIIEARDSINPTPEHLLSQADELIKSARVRHSASPFLYDTQ